MPTDVYSCSNAEWIQIAGYDKSICKLTNDFCPYNLLTKTACTDFKLWENRQPTKKDNYTVK